jgi:hypothetical protein
VGRAVVGHALAHDHARIVDCLGDGQNLEITAGQIRDAIQVRHLAVCKKEGVHRSIFDRGKPDDQSRGVDAERAALVPAEGAEVGRVFVRPLEGVISGGLGNVGGADDVGSVVAVGRAPGAGQGAEVLQLAIFIKECVKGTVRDQRGTDDVAGGIHAVGGAGGAAKGAEIGDVK